MANTSNNPGNASRAEQTTAAAAQKVGDMASQAGQRAQEALSSAAQRAGETASNLGQRAEEMASSAAQRAGETVSSLGQGMSSLAGTLRHSAPQQGMLGTAADAVADRLEAGGQYLQERNLADMTDDLSGLIRQHPLPSMMVVFGLGFLVGNVLRR